MADRLQKGDLVLVTGAAGLIGSAIAEELLKRHFRVRGVTRDASKEQWMQEKFDKLYGNGHFEWVEVKDGTKSNAYEEALKGVDGIIHAATDTSFSPDYDTVVNSSVAMTVNILEAAIQVPSVKSAVVTSSRVAIYSPEYGKDLDISLSDWNETSVKLAQESPVEDPAKAVYVYTASKVKAEQAVWNFVKEKKPSFAVNTVLPETVIGKADANPAKRVYSTSTWIREIFDGKTDGFGAAFLNPTGFVVDVKDTALIHIGALLASDYSGERLWAAAHAIHINEVLKIWRKQYPNRQLPADFDFPALPKLTIDNSRSTQLLQRYAGRGYISAEQSFLENVE